MGGSSKAQTIGYRYCLGMHAIFVHGPVDHASKIEFDKRAAWEGINTGGTITVNAPSLFGGDDREGGVAGLIDFQTGDPAQGINSYLAGQLGEFTPAFRNVAGFVLRGGVLFTGIQAAIQQFYFGNNPYLKPISARLQRIHKTKNGETQWYDSKAEVFGFNSTSAPFFDDFSDGNIDEYTHFTAPSTGGGGSIADFSVVSDTYGEALHVSTGPANTHTAIKRPLLKAAPLQEVHFKCKLVSRNDDDCGLIALRDADLNNVVSFGLSRQVITDSQRRPAVAFIDQNLNPGNPIGPNGGLTVGVWYQVDITYNAATSEFTCTITNLATSLVHGSITIPVTGRSDIANVAFENDNYNGTGAGTARFTDVQIITSSTNGDMNPAHIIRECLVDPVWGIGYVEADVDDVSFTAAANTLYNEGMGISLLWDKQTAIEDFVKEIIKHIDAALYVDRQTGKFTLKLIRNDYDVGTLITLDESNVDKLENFQRSAFGELTNSVTVNYWDSQTGNDASLTVQDIALSQMQGATINTTLQYPGFTNQNIAARVGQRDLITLSTPLISCTVFANRDAADLTVGSVFKLTWPDYEIENLVMRVTGIAYGDGRNNHIRITCTQDIFALPETSFVNPSPPIWQDPSTLPEPVNFRQAFEVPYLELVQIYGQREVDEALTGTPTLGHVGIAGQKPNAGSFKARMHTDSGAGYTEVAVMDFCPTATVNEAVTPSMTTFAIANKTQLDEVPLGTWFQVGSEIMGVVSIDDTLNTITVLRGCLDTVPVSHAVADKMYFWDSYSALDPTEYVSGESVDIKLTTITGQGELAVIDAPVDTVTLAQRAWRPYPPGNVKVNTLYFPEYVTNVNLALTWAHRDRTQETGATLIDYTYGNIGPEASSTYTLKLYNENNILAKTYSGLTGTSQTWTTEIDDSAIPGDPAAGGDPYWSGVVLNAHMNGANGGTTFTDSSSSPKTITRVGNTVTSTARIKYGTASALFDGTLDGLTVSSSTNFSCNVDFCCEGWFYLDSAVTGRTIQYLFSNRPLSGGVNNSSFSFNVVLSGGNWYLGHTVFDDAGTAAGINDTTTPITMNAWHHAAIYRIGNVWYIALDGVILASQTVAIANTQTNPLLIGHGNLGPDARREIFGNMDDVRFTRGFARYPATNFTPPTVENPNLGAYRLNQTMKYEIYTVRGGIDSMQKQTHTVKRYGYGFWYGQNYGGI